MKPWLRMLAGRLRLKALGAALCVVLIACFGSWVSLRYTKTVMTSVTDTTETYLPLLTHAIDASDAMRRLTSRAHALLLSCEAADGARQVLPDGSLSTEFEVIERLTAFLQSVGIREYEVKVTSAKDELVDAFRALSNICDTQAGLQRSFEDQRAQAMAAIASLGGIINRLRQDYRPPSGASGNTQAILPFLEVLSARLTEVENELAQSHSNSQVKAGDALVVKTRDAVSGLSAAFEDVGPLLDDDGRTREREQIRGLIDSLSRTILGPGGIREIWNRTSLFYSGTVITRMALTRADMALAWALQGMESEARSRYRHALDETRSTTEEARWVVSSVTVVIALVLLAAGWMVAARLTRPIERLKAFVMKLRGSEDLSHAVPEQLLRRKDEIGALAQTFNSLIADLADARKRLLSESRAEIQTQYERLSAAIESIPQGLCLIDADSRLLVSNSRFMSIYDLSPGDLRVGTALSDVIATCQENGAMPMDGDSPRGQAADPGASIFQRPLLLLNFRNERTILIRSARTPEGGWVSVHEDITERRRQEKQIEHLAYHDTLTGLANRRLFRDTFGELLARDRRPCGVVLLYMDLDMFKTVNDTLGHPVGDQLLVAVAERLQACLRDTDHVARVGGDEFAVLLTDNPTNDEAIRVSGRIIEKIALPFDINGHEIVIGISVGIAISPRDGTDPDRLMKCADMAMYRAKGEGRNRYCFFEPEMGTKIHARRTLELELRKAVEMGDLELYYQPQVESGSRQIAGFEALIRWHHKERGDIPPEEFISVAEDSGLITEIGRWVLEQACLEAMSWPDSIQVAVNVSPVQFRSAKALLSDVRSALLLSGLPAHRLELEITEGILMQDTAANLELLDSLRRMGVHIAMDDFGTGYSSLGYIRRFCFDRIKIDRSFINDVTTSKDSQAVVQAVCGLCSTLGIQTVAEGVENEQQLQFLFDEGCSLIQGYYIARPMAVADLQRLIVDWTAAL
ncbi:EAL domain-containing protein [Marinobacter halodurans]|uniref:EAL domain-containing protein n=1 Tax=Marinobacter halodurans TaxID=2528979 RepID=UPI0013F1581B|nr:EAL domain-containing protein [Marinobacter halodurans]